MKYSLFILFSIATLSCFAQLDKSVSISATCNFNVALGEPGKDATKGIGFYLDASLFSKHRLHVVVESGIDHFFGIDGIYIDYPGKLVKSNFYSIKAGPQFFLSKNLALSTTFGPSWYVTESKYTTTEYGFKYSVTGFLGKKRRFITKLFMIHIPSNNSNFQYLGLGAGYRL